MYTKPNHLQFRLDKDEFALSRREHQNSVGF